MDQNPHGATISFDSHAYFRYVKLLFKDQYRTESASRLIVLFLFLSLLSCGNKKGEYSITRFDLGRGRSIEILASNEMEVTQSFYYRVTVADKTVVPLSLICVGHDTGTLTFRTIAAQNGELVGIFEQRFPDEILAVHDFSSNITWPRPLDYEKPVHRDQIGHELLNKLQVEHTERSLKFARDSGCN